MTLTCNRQALLAVALCALALGACGSDDGDIAVKSPAASSTATGSSSSQSRGGQLADAGLKFARCMREQGVDMPDPKKAANGLTMLEPPSGDVDTATLERAQGKCQKHLDQGLPEPSAGEKAKLRKGSLKFARCMREQGIDMPDPSGDGGIAIGTDSGLNPDDPAFQRAQKACGKHLSGDIF